MTNNVETVAHLSQKGRRSLYYVATGLAQYPGSRSKASLKRLASLGLVDSWKKPQEAKLTHRGEKIATDAGWQLKGDGAQLALFDAAGMMRDLDEALAIPLPGPDPTDPKEPALAARSPLKWCGSTGKLLASIVPALPATFGMLFVPFVGGGSLPFAIGCAGAYLSDANPHLVNVYIVIRDSVEDLILALQDHRNDRAYYDALKESFNDGYGDPVWRAAAFIYMNKVGFNGLCRYNRAGKYNVPFGDNPKATICDADNLRACSVALRGTTIEAADFRDVDGMVQPGDCLYIDPPYLPESKTASFTGYWGTWTDQDHEDVAAMFRRLAARGVHVLASNSDTPKVRELYDGFEMRTLTRANSINSKASARGGKAELLILGGTWTPRGAT